MYCAHPSFHGDVRWYGTLLRTLPFHLEEALYSSSLAYQNCQHHCSCALLSKIKATWTQALRCLDSHPITEAATKWLAGGQRTERGHTGWKDDSRLGWDAADRYAIPACYSDCMQLRPCKSFLSEVFHGMFLNHSWQQVTETKESEIMDKGENTVHVYIFGIFLLFLKVRNLIYYLYNC